MKSVNNLIKLAERFAYKLAQQTAQPGEIASALKAAGLFDKSAEVAPLLNAAGVPDDVKVEISIMVDKTLNCTYVVDTNPAKPAAAIKLRGLLGVKYGSAMKKALAAAGISVTDTMRVGWLTF
jgi:hypothetical protein